MSDDYGLLRTRPDYRPAGLHWFTTDMPSPPAATGIPMCGHACFGDLKTSFDQGLVSRCDIVSSQQLSVLFYPIPLTLIYHFQLTDLFELESDHGGAGASYFTTGGYITPFYNIFVFMVKE